MSFWIELKCDSRKSPRCCSNCTADEPMMLTPNERSFAFQALKTLEREGIAAGWKKIKGGDMICPDCQKA